MLSIGKFSIEKLLLKQKDQYQPVLLFGYSSSSLDPDTIDALLANAGAGRVRLAILNPRESEGENETLEYEGRGILVPTGVDKNQWIEFRQQHSIDDDDRIALTRPLRGMESEGFITDSSLWSSVDSPPSQ